MDIKPLQNRLIVKRDAGDEVSKGGIILPTNAKEKPIMGTVVASGKGKLLENGTIIPTGVKAGDRILFGKYGGTEIKLDGEDLLVLNADDVLGVVEDS